MIRQFFETLWRAIIRIFAFIGKEVRAILHQPRLVFSLILGPFLILLIFGLGYRNAPRTLNTLFVVPEGSQMEGYVQEYAKTLGGSIAFAGITHDPEEADRRLRNKEVDLVVVTPFDPATDWENNEQSTFVLYHNEIDPLEEGYIQVLGQQYAQEINRQVLLTAVAQSQQEAGTWQQDVAQAKTHVTALRQALAAGEKVRAQNSAAELKQELDLLTLTLGSGVALMSSLEEATGSQDTTSSLLAELETLQNESDQMVTATASDDPLNQSEASTTELENSLNRVDTLLTTFRDMDTEVLVAPFRSQLLSITQVRIEQMHFYVPAVIALLLQHLAITLAGLSIVREKLGGAMELFRAAPVSSFEMLFGKYVSYLLLIGVLAAVLTGLVVWGLNVPQLGLWGNYVLIILALLLASLGIGFHISLSAGSHSQAIQYGMLTLLAAIFFSGFFLPLYRLSPGVRVISWMLPATYGTVLLKDVMLRGQAPPLLLMGALYGFAAVLFVLAWIRLRRQMVME